MLQQQSNQADLTQRAMLQVNPTVQKEQHQFVNLRPQTTQLAASSVVAAAQDPFRTPPQKKEDYCQED